MAKQKRASKRAVKPSAESRPAKNKPARSTATKAANISVSKSIKTAAKARAKASATPTTRRKQRVAVSHYREEDFVADGLRAYARYRDLGVAAASGGIAQAHVIRLIGPCDPKEVSKLHYHDAEFQLVYVLNGWVKAYMEGEGEMLMRPGSCWTQPPRIRHLIRDYSDNCELLEVILPAEFKTVEVKA